MGDPRSEVLTVSDGVSLRVVVRTGTHPRRVLLVHGLASNARLWDGVADRLALGGVGSVAVDLRGHGQSDRPDDGYDFATISDDLACVLEHFGGPWLLVGQSWGGNVVLDLAVRHPEGVEGLVLVDGGFIKLADEMPDLDDALERLRPPDFDGLTPDELRSAAASWFEGFPGQGVEAQLANFEETGDGRLRPRLTLDRHLAIVTRLHGQDPDALVAELSIPVVVAAVGAEGERPRVAQFASHGRDVTVHWIAGHHDIHAQRPDAIAAVIRSLG